MPTWFPSVGLGELPAVDSETMREADRIAVSVFGLSILQMMENAGRALADLALDLFAPKRATILVGKGGNAGGGLAGARHLMNRGIPTNVALAFPLEELKREPGAQLITLKRIGAEVVEDPAVGDLVIDALLGYGIAGSPTGRVAALIDWTKGTASAGGFSRSPEWSRLLQSELRPSRSRRCHTHSCSPEGRSSRRARRDR